VGTRPGCRNGGVLLPRGIISFWLYLEKMQRKSAPISSERFFCTVPTFAVLTFCDLTPRKSFEAT
jgi:hypothetical protein